MSFVTCFSLCHVFFVVSRVFFVVSRVFLLCHELFFVCVTCLFEVTRNLCSASPTSICHDYQIMDSMKQRLEALTNFI